MPWWGWVLIGFGAASMLFGWILVRSTALGERTDNEAWELHNRNPANWTEKRWIAETAKIINQLKDEADKEKRDRDNR
jgi:hypothetical protein